jgi:hypothetical protein
VDGYSNYEKNILTMKKILTEKQRQENLIERGKAIVEAFQTVYQGLEELSPETKTSAIQKMKDRGQDQRAGKWEQHYAVKDLEQFKDLPIYDDSIIYNFRLDDNGHIEISYGSPRTQQYNRHFGKTIYNPNDDSYYGATEISRKTARILSKIAMTVNPDTKYRNGVGDFKIKGY